MKGIWDATWKSFKKTMMKPTMGAIAMMVPMKTTPEARNQA